MKKAVFAGYIILIIFTALFSYTLVDPNITFMQNRYWVMFREFVLYIGYYRRDITWALYACITVLLFAFHFYFIKKYKDINPVMLALFIGGVLLFSYPFLSHDLFNYMFDARILTFYGKNPYLLRALDFPLDPWTRFMHWTHRSYPYGPVFLVLSIIPSLLGLGKFTLTFLLFKGMFVSFYAVSVSLLARLNKKWAVIFATHPLILMEGLISSHNDMAALGLSVIGIYLLLKESRMWQSRLFILLSGGIKYTTFVLLVLRKAQSAGQRLGTLERILSGNWNRLVFMAQVLVLAYLCLRMGIQPWYFITLFAFLPFFPGLLIKLNIFFFGLMVSYYPYIRLGGWDTSDKVELRYEIITLFAVLNVLYLLADGLFHLSHRQRVIRKSAR